MHCQLLNFSALMTKMLFFWGGGHIVQTYLTQVRHKDQTDCSLATDTCSMDEMVAGRRKTVLSDCLHVIAHFPLNVERFL